METANGIDYDGLRAHVIATLEIAYNDGVEATRTVGSAWGEVAFKAAIAERAVHQKFVAPTVYARIAATVFAESAREIALDNKRPNYHY